MLLWAITFAAFSPSLQQPFVRFDDGDYFLRNPEIQRGFSWAHLRWAFTSFYFSSWHPLTWLSHTLDWTLWGPNPAGHHLTSLLLHATSGALLYAFLLRATAALAPSLASAALFALHPQRVESVVWVSERKDVLSVFFFVLLLHAWLSWARRPSAGRYLAVLLLFACGLLSKAMLVTAPLALLLVDVWPLRRWPRLRDGLRPRALLEKLPLFALSALVSVFTVQSQRGSGSVVALAALPLHERLANAAINACSYLGKAAWPFSLAAHYPLPAEPLSARWLSLAASVAVLAAITALCVRFRRELPQAWVGWCWFLVLLLPVIGLVQVGTQAIADRYSYLPLIGPFTALCFSVPWEAPPATARWVRAGALALAAALIALTVRQVGFWADTRALFTRVLEVSPGDPLALAALGQLAVREGRAGEAEGYFRGALATWPGYAVALGGMGSVALARHQPEAALDWFRRAMAAHREPGEWAPGAAWALEQLGRAAEAVQLLEPFVAADPGKPALHRELGLALAALGRDDRAEQEFQAAVRLDPDDPISRLDLGTALANQGRLAEAGAQLRAALAVDPELAQARELLRRVEQDAALPPGTAARPDAGGGVSP